ncbi:MAG: hypothetical protein WCE54_13300 [Ignavibacteriaceae bacterium]
MNKKTNWLKISLISGMLVLCSLSSFIYKDAKSEKKDTGFQKHPRIVNIINFIRLLEPRDPEITKDVLYETVVKQIEIIKRYKLRGTFLIQYDALIDQRYQSLLKSLDTSEFEIGAWWEIPQPMVERAGLKWRGRYPWDWRANIGFSTGYSVKEREKLADVYMKEFKSIFGYYPESVGSWFIDAYTLNYLYKKYRITASCNCKDQYGTDGYTLWGGYWNQAYYPSKINAYMPAQNEVNQIPVPVFRMLGSDPVRQYDYDVGTSRQGVITLEPVYKFGGGDSAWVNWYFKEFIQGACVSYAYTQMGQENSFTWKAMSKGFNIQIPLIARLKDQKKIKIETLKESGKWFKNRFNVTPPTSVTVNEDIGGSSKKTVWFDSRYFRANLFWENGRLRFRDIHLFNEKLSSAYYSKKATSNDCSFFTLPFVDGFIWSDSSKIAGLRFKAVINGKDVLLQGFNPVITDSASGKLLISWPLKSFNGTLVMDLNESRINMKLITGEKINWFLELTASENSKLPFLEVEPGRVECRFEGLNYSVAAVHGSFSKPGKGIVLRIIPEKNSIILNFDTTD